MRHRCRTQCHKETVGYESCICVVNTVFRGRKLRYNEIPPFFHARNTNAHKHPHTHIRTHHAQSKVIAGRLTEGRSPTVCVRKGWIVGCHCGQWANPHGQSKAFNLVVSFQCRKSIRYIVSPLCTTQRCISIPLWINAKTVTIKIQYNEKCPCTVLATFY